MHPDPAVADIVQGLGTLISLEHTLLASVGAELRSTERTSLDDSTRMLRGQRIRVGTGLSLLTRCCALLPKPARFTSQLHPLSSLAGQERRMDPAVGLSGLLAQHQHLHDGYVALAENRNEDEVYELLLAELARNHLEMAEKIGVMLRARLQSTASARAVPAGRAPCRRR